MDPFSKQFLRRMYENRVPPDQALQALLKCASQDRVAGAVSKVAANHWFHQGLHIAGRIA